MLTPSTEIDGLKYCVNGDGLAYPYPAYYNFDTGGILDSSQGDIEGRWILKAYSEMVLYNIVTHAVLTPSEIEVGGTYSMILSGQQRHPDWILTAN
tara:strand:+ start:467 stop:754 length:288 start_codon:yes stop_codon:yes gene_type:complete